MVRLSFVFRRFDTNIEKGSALVFRIYIPCVHKNSLELEGLTRKFSFKEMVPEGQAQNAIIAEERRISSPLLFSTLKRKKKQKNKELRCHISIFRTERNETHTLPLRESPNIQRLV